MYQQLGDRPDHSITGRKTIKNRVREWLLGPSALVLMNNAERLHLLWMAYSAMADLNTGDLVTETEWDKIRTNFAHFAADHAHVGGTGDGALMSTVIADTELGATAASINFASIPATYKHLVFVTSLRTDRAGATDGVLIRFNGDSGANYDSIFNLFRHPSTHTSLESIAATAINWGDIATAESVPGNTGVANSFGSARFIITDYLDGTNLPAIAGTGGYKSAASTTNIRSLAGFGQWRTATAINRVEFFPHTGSNFAAGSRITLLGVV